MISNEWNDIFDIIEVYDTEDFMNNHCTEVKKDAVAALASCINTIGHVDINWMQAVSDFSRDELVEALEGIIYQDPKGYERHQSDDEDWLLRSQYLSGNIKDKLYIATMMNGKYHGRFDANVRVLKEVMPERVKFENIGISIGSPWVPKVYYSLFAKEILGLRRLPEVSYSKTLGQWKVTGPASARKAIHNVYTFGTRRMSALKILEHTLNASTVKIYDEVERPERKSGTARILNKNETLAAQEKQELLQKAFQKWIGKDPLRVKQMENIFYSTYVCNVACRFNGSFLTLPDINPDFIPYPHQKNAVARIILEKDVLLNHAVGSGKTNILIMGVHERKRLGLSEKNLVVVPNNVLEAFERAHNYLYPEDKILVIKPEEFKPKSRQKMLEMIRDEDYVAVYMAFSSFEMIGMSRQFKLNQKEKEIQSIRVKVHESEEKWEKMRLEWVLSHMCDELEKMRVSLPEDKYLPFDELGISTLVVDEIHNFKNISLDTRAEGVVGMHAKGSKKCDELMEKVRYVRNHNGGVLFSTGTPITNSIADLFVLQIYMQPEQMELLRLGHFDEWIGNFATRQTGFEVDVDSQSYRIMTRFSSFYNLPELISLFSSICDFYNGTDSGVGLPECNGYIDTIIPKSEEQATYIDDLVIRTELIREKHVSGTQDNLLKVTHDGRAAALDIRLADMEAKPDPEGTKTFACAQNVYACWKKYPGTAQLVFCDLGTPKKAFNVYDELKKHLIRMGIPEREIAFVHDAATDAERRKLFKSVNCADVRVLIGSTSKLGTGVNVQEHLIAIHHLDVPWRPSDMVQREGRLIRQGNRNKKVFRYRYITAGTFDAYSWQIVENKQRFIGQFMNGILADRDARNLDDAVLTYAEIKALSVGDPLLKTRIEVSNALERVKVHSYRREQELRKMRNIIAESPMKMDRLEQCKERLARDRSHFIKNRKSLTKAERTAFGEELLYALRSNCGKTEERCFKYLHGFQVILPAYMEAERPKILISGVTLNRYDVDMKDAKESGCIQRIEYVLMHLEDRIQRTQEEIECAKEEVLQAENEIKKGNTYAHEVTSLGERLLDIDGELNRRANEIEM